METLAERLFALRKAQKWTRKTVAEKIGTAERTYQRYENAEREPTASVLMALADLYNTSIDYLVGRTDNPDINR